MDFLCINQQIRNLFLQGFIYAVGRKPPGMVASGLPGPGHPLMFSIVLPVESLAGDLRYRVQGRRATMKTTLEMTNRVSRVCRCSIGVLAVAGLAIAQDQAHMRGGQPTDPSPAWRAGSRRSGRRDKIRARKTRVFAADQQNNPGAPPTGSKGRLRRITDRTLVLVLIMAPTTHLPRRQCQHS